MPKSQLPAINQVAISGKLTAEPEFRLSEANPPRCSFRLAVSRFYRDPGNEWQQDTTFVPVSVFGRSAESTARRLKRGSEIFLTGRLVSRTVDGKNGTITVLEVIARSIQFPDQGKTEEDAEEDMGPPMPF